MTLAEARAGDLLVLGRPELPVPVTRRLAELGLRPGARLLVLRKTVGGGRLVAAGGARIALGRDLAARVLVHAAPGGSTTTARTPASGDRS